MSAKSGPHRRLVLDREKRVHRLLRMLPLRQQHFETHDPLVPLVRYLALIEPRFDRLGGDANVREINHQYRRSVISKSGVIVHSSEVRHCHPFFANRVTTSDSV